MPKNKPKILLPAKPDNNTRLITPMTERRRMFYKVYCLICAELVPLGNISPSAAEPKRVSGEYLLSTLARLRQHCITAHHIHPQLIAEAKAVEAGPETYLTLPNGIIAVKVVQDVIIVR